MRPPLKTATAVLAALSLAAAGLAACGRPGAPAGGEAASLKIASQKGGTRALMEAAGVLDGAPYKI